MLATDFQSKVVVQSCIAVSPEPSVQELAEVERRWSIGDLKALVHANEDNIFTHARAIDPLTLPSQLLLHLPRLVTADYFPDEADIQREILAVSDSLEENQRPYAR